MIARFNERRCKGLPLFGQDLIHALFVMKPADKGSYNATTATSSAAAATPSKRAAQSGSTTQGPARSRRPLQTSGSLGYMECINAATPGSSHYREEIHGCYVVLTLEACRTPSNMHLVMLDEPKRPKPFFLLSFLFSILSSSSNLETIRYLA